ncbi:MAG: hypothetical protein WBV33_05915 [Terracidiphilus sp.]
MPQQARALPEVSVSRFSRPGTFIFGIAVREGSFCGIEAMPALAATECLPAEHAMDSIQRVGLL